MFDHYDDSDITDDERAVFINYTHPVGPGVKYFRYLTYEIEDYEIQQLTKVFPNTELFFVEAENVFHHNFNLKECSKLKDICLRWLSSDEFADIDSDESEEKYKFKLELT